jgi:SAM-dependent methyltransferase
MAQNIYDNPGFFAEYDRMREHGLGMNESMEQPAIRSLFPGERELAGMRVLDMGCGAGETCRLLAESGAASVTGMDVSRNMLEKAALKPHPAITYIHMAAEEASFEPGSFDFVVSSLMLHYIEDISPLIRNVRSWLRDGGRFVFSMEHPVATAGQGFEESPGKGFTNALWLTDENGKRDGWKLMRYADEGRRVSTWFVDGVVKYHRTTATIINTLIDSGFEIERMLEPHASEEVERERPELIEERIRPPFLYVSARAS